MPGFLIIIAIIIISFFLLRHVAFTAGRKSKWAMKLTKVLLQDSI